MTIVYLDYNCFQRGFDDSRQIRIQMEALACQEIFERAEAGQIQLVWSFMHEDETAICPFLERKYGVLRLSALCQIRLGPREEIRDLAYEFQKQGGLSAKDALHLACAAYVGADVFVTCDARLIRQARRLDLKVKIVNPIDYVREEDEPDVQGG